MSEQKTLVLSLISILAAFHNIFEEPSRISSTASAVLYLKQGTFKGKYAIKFRTLVSEFTLKETLVVALYERLSGYIKWELGGGVLILSQPLKN